MRKIISSLILSLIVFSSKGQNVGIGTNNPHPSAALDITDSSKGILIPRMSMSQRNNIQNPAEGLMVYQTDSTKGFYYFNGVNWSNIIFNQNIDSYSVPTLRIKKFTFSGVGTGPTNNSGLENIIDTLIIKSGHSCEIEFNITGSFSQGYMYFHLDAGDLTGDLSETTSDVGGYHYSGSATRTGKWIIKNQSSNTKSYILKLISGASFGANYNGTGMLINRVF